jgi:hypothetical protein
MDFVVRMMIKAVNVYVIVKMADLCRGLWKDFRQGWREGTNENAQKR